MPKYRVSYGIEAEGEGVKIGSGDYDYIWSRGYAYRWPKDATVELVEEPLPPVGSVIIDVEGDIWFRHGLDGRWSMTSPRGAVVERTVEQVRRDALRPGYTIVHTGSE